MAKNISVTVKFWKQNGPKDKGHFEKHEMKNVPDDTSFLEMLDMMNEELIAAGNEPFVFDHDCREGICGMCSLYINGTPHGKTERGATTCQLYMRKFNDGDVITLALKRGGKVTPSAFEADLLSGVVTLTAEAIRRTDDGDLYSTTPPTEEDCTAKAIPYYTWANRGENQMRVWMDEVR